jgi:hypothetical protein
LSRVSALAFFVAVSSPTLAHNVITQPAKGITHLHQTRTDPLQNIHLLFIDLDEPTIGFEVVLAGDDRDNTGQTELTSEMAIRKGAFAAINGDYFGPGDHGYEGMTWVLGEKVNPDIYRSSLAISADHRVSIAKGLREDPSFHYNVIGGGPQFIEGGVPYWDRTSDIVINGETFDQSAADWDAANPWTAAGLTQDGRTLILAVIDGRQPGTVGVGMSPWEVGDLLVEWGAAKAIRFDSGGSSTVFLDGKVVNSPSDPGGERPVGNALIVYAERQDFEILSPRREEAVPTVPLFEWTRGNYNVFGLYLKLPVNGTLHWIFPAYYPIWTYHTHFDLARFNPLWSWVDYDSWALWFVLAVNTGTVDLEVSDVWGFMKPDYGSDWDGDGYSESEGDCDDVDFNVNPAAVEGIEWLTGCLDQVDNDCDGFIDLEDEGCFDLQRTIPETGIVDCYSDTATIECPLEGDPFYGQDAQYPTTPMSYKVSNDGVTVTDNVTGLIWQRMDDDTTRSWGNAITYCEGLDLVGYTDWRLPNELELQSIVDYGEGNLTIDTTAFPGTDPEWYWASPTYACYTENAWFVDFGFPLVSATYKGHKYYVRCVRGKSTILSFTDNLDGTVTDNATGIMWQQESHDQLVTWEAALAYCEELVLPPGRHSDWRLPDVKELRSILDNTRCGPATDTSVFPQTDLSWHWSSSTSTYEDHSHYGLYVDFVGGFVISALKTESHYVRCVR